MGEPSLAELLRRARSISAACSATGQDRAYTERTRADLPGTIEAVVSAAGSGLDRLYRSADRGDSWSWCGVELPPFGRISFDPVEENALYGILWQNGTSQLFRSTDGCHQWEPVSREAASLSAVVPVGHSTFYAMGDRRLVRSEDRAGCRTGSWNGLVKTKRSRTRYTTRERRTVVANATSS